CRRATRGFIGARTRPPSSTGNRRRHDASAGGGGSPRRRAPRAGRDSRAPRGGGRRGDGGDRVGGRNVALRRGGRPRPARRGRRGGGGPGRARPPLFGHGGPAARRGPAPRRRAPDREAPRRDTSRRRLRAPLGRPQPRPPGGVRGGDGRLPPRRRRLPAARPLLRDAVVDRVELARPVAAVRAAGVRGRDRDDREEAAGDGLLRDRGAPGAAPAVAGIAARAGAVLGADRREELRGGVRAGEGRFVTDKIPFARPMLGDEEIAEVVDTLRSGWLTTGPKTRRLEQAFAAEIGVPVALGTNSCPAPLHLGLAALG